MAAILPLIVGDEQAPAVLDLAPDAGAQTGEQEVAGFLQAGRHPAFHPDAGNLVVFVRAGGTDDRILHR